MHRSCSRALHHPFTFHRLAFTCLVFALWAAGAVFRPSLQRSHRERDAAARPHLRHVHQRQQSRQVAHPALPELVSFPAAAPGSPPRGADFECPSARGKLCRKSCPFAFTGKGQSLLHVQLGVFGCSRSVAIQCVKNKIITSQVFSPAASDRLAGGGLGLNTDALNCK